MSSALTKITIVAIVCACLPAKADELTPAEKAAQDYCIETISIGTTLEQFQKRFPHAQCRRSDRSVGTSRWSTSLSGKQSLIVSFFEGRVYILGTWLHSETIQSIGGVDVLVRRLEDTFGSPTSDDRDSSPVWHFPKVGRMIVLHIGDGEDAVVGVTDMAAEWHVLEKRESQLDLGF